MALLLIDDVVVSMPISLSQLSMKTADLIASVSLEVDVQSQLEWPPAARHLTDPVVVGVLVSRLVEDRFASAGSNVIISSSVGS